MLIKLKIIASLLFILISSIAVLVAGFIIGTILAMITPLLITATIIWFIWFFNKDYSTLKESENG